ncbi:flagellar protein FlaG [Pseudoalteromonas sp. JB197]|uniref:flagellar protein FlaG n=1 Tax=Pseudoalteromonas sp. JB197 TaxID=1434839 RepID=UPI00097F52EB|nr:flagellar protein FlaG [Pseudoalteromonas sp. JB197]PCC13427.1 flagellar biosynthesis protein FlaG [Pseudoalteromonas sp. JB197]SJN33141.1 Flagellin protein FlaG [Pseudoalteromonas sp. JB197]
METQSLLSQSLLSKNKLSQNNLIPQSGNATENTLPETNNSNSLNDSSHIPIYKKDTLTSTELSSEKLEKVVQQLQDFMGEMNRSIQFKVDEESGRNVIKVIDKASGDLVKQYPSEEVLGIVSKLAETTGVLIDFKV